MEASIIELSEQMGVSPDTVDRWVRQGKLPVTRKGSRFLFKTRELKRWAISNNIRLKIFTKTDDKKIDLPVTLAQAVENGGVYSNLSGGDVESVLSEAVSLLGAIPDNKKNDLFNQLIERETALSTGIGNGFAVPHPRQQQDYLENPVVGVFFLNNPVDYKALDNTEVSVLFMIICPDLKMHLKLLSGISFCLKNAEFMTFLKRQPDQNELLAQIRLLEEKNPN